MKNIRSILMILLVFAIVLTEDIYMPSYVYAAGSNIAKAQGRAVYTGRDCTSDDKGAKAIDYVMNLYEHDTWYPHDGLCLGYAQEVNGIIAETSKVISYKGLIFNSSNVIKKCKGIKAGTHIRVSNSKTYTSSYGHSIILLKVTSGKVYWTDNNSGNGYNRVHYYSATVRAFVYKYSDYKYLNRIVQTLSYDTVPSIELVGKKNSLGGTFLDWNCPSKTKEFKVYRSGSRDSGYKLIKRTKQSKYTDNYGVVGRKYYYKVKAITTKVTIISNTLGSVKKLETPKVTATTQASSGLIKIQWKSVPKTDLYSIYRWSRATGKYIPIKKTTSLSYIDKKATGGKSCFRYKVKAIYLNNTAGNSKFSDATVALSPRVKE